MCNAVSWFYVRHGGATRLLISEKSDSHTEIAKEFGVRDTAGDVAAGEFSPDEENPSPDPKTWRLVWDYHDISRRPDWMDAEAESHLRAELEKRCDAYVFTTGTHEVDSCRAFAFGDAKITTKGNCRAVLRNSSRAELWGSSRASLRDSSSAVLWGLSRASLRDSSSAVLWGLSSAELWDSSSAELWDSSSAELWDSSRAELRGLSRAVLRNLSSAVLRDSSSAELWNSSRAELRDSSSAELWNSSRAELRSAHADILGRLLWDGKGCRPVRCDIEIGKTYVIVGGKLAEVEAKAKGGEA